MLYYTSFPLPILLKDCLALSFKITVTTEVR